MERERVRLKPKRRTRAPTVDWQARNQAKHILARQIIDEMEQEIDEALDEMENENGDNR